MVLKGSNRISTDVLVVGSGGAGLRASLEARSQKTNVLLVSKSPLGANTCTLYSAGGFKAGLGGPTSDELFRKTLHWGRCINNRQLLRILAEEGPSRILELEKLGVNIIPRTGGCWVTGPPPISGEGLIAPLKEEALHTGVKILERAMIIELIIEDGTFIGALAIDAKARVVLIEAKSAVLATGGGSQIYGRTDNPRGITGNGYVLAFEAGAELLDMEFIQFSPLGLAEPDMPLSLFSIPPSTLVNSHDENIMEKYGLTVEEHDDLLARAIEREMHDRPGAGGAVFADLTKIPSSFWEEENNHTRHVRWLLRDHSHRRRVRIAPLAHYFLGGVSIDHECRTTVPGLYAAGEVTGGIHGANRLGGNALTEVIVFGSRAGKFAAEYAKAKRLTSIEPTLVERKKKEIEEILGRRYSERNSTSTIRRKIEETMWNHVGIVRHQDSLEEGIEKLKYLRAQAEEIAAKDRAELIETLEIKNMVRVGQLITLAAQFRKESRGSHYRSDYPSQDDKKWLKNVIISRKGQEAKLSTRKPVGSNNP